MKKIVFFIFLCLWSFSFSQNNDSKKEDIVIDSIKIVIDTLRYSQGHFMGKNNDSIEKYTKKGIEASQLINDYQNIIQFKKNLAIHYVVVGDYAISCPIYHEILELSQSYNLKREIVQGYSNLAYCFRKNREYFKAFKALQNSLDVVESLEGIEDENYIKKRKFYINKIISYVYYETKNYDLVLKKLDQTKQFASNEENLIEIEWLEGNSLEKIKEYDKAYKKYLSVQKFFENDKKYKTDLPRVYFDIISLGVNTENTNLIKKYLYKQDSLSNELSKDFKSNNTHLSKTNFAKGYVAYRNNNLNKAKRYFELSNTQSSDIENIETALKNYKFLYEISKKENNTTNIIKYSELVIKYKDSIANYDKNLEFYRDQIAFELNALDKKKEIEFTEEKSRIHRESIIKQRNIIFVSLIILSIFAIGLVLYNIKLQRTNKEVARLSAVKSSFLSKASHELKTPINAILGFLNFLKSTKLSNVQKEYVNYMWNSSDSLQIFIQNIINFTSSQQKENLRAKLNLENINLRDFCSEIKASSMHLIMDKKLKLYLYFDESIDYNVIADKEKLSIILKNFLCNAIRFSDEGKIIFEVKLDSELEDYYIINFSIKDEGIGIAADDLEKIFDNHYQVEEKYENNSQGLGLGLSTNKRLLELMGSNIRVDSELGVGSTFDFNLTLKKDFSVQNTVSQTRRYSFKELKQILIVEDNRLSMLLLKKIIESNFDSVKILTANDGKECIEKFSDSKNDIDFIFLDIQLPIINGFEAAAKIRKTQINHVPIIALTAGYFEEEKHIYLESGIDKIMEKPINSQKIIEVLKQTFP